MTIDPQDPDWTALAPIRELAVAKDCAPAQILLAWLLAQGEDIVPIPGCKTLAHLEDNIRAAEIELTQHDRARLDALMPPEAAKGPREQVTGRTG